MRNGILRVPVSWQTLYLACFIVVSFHEQLLQKDRRQRLGARDDLDELRHTAFFGSIDFNALNARQIQPPYRPAVQDELDTANIDREFTDMPVPSMHMPAIYVRNFIEVLFTGFIEHIHVFKEYLVFYCFIMVI